MAKALSYIVLIFAGLCMLGALGSIFIGMMRAGQGGVEGARRSNRMMWWRVRLQLAAIVLIIIWYFLKNA
ncbi:twin transmembrane helix small protein [Vineibacter terrae]|uniref:Twin transmembrane helix small protein n=1 Tax=Vineibacter terrae TaxID=2586908 RepID=A0A5C8PCT0_9HYPH|nr:HIG1 domain-containing protein [Vineibacter terrae]TXL71306.1 twin transmembrane helix small protein [Vineibacter terrae]